ncbi:MAG: ChuX/HutX family heme-like substrate-binding protein [Pseudomonadota bacterium]
MPDLSWTSLFDRVASLAVTSPKLQSRDVATRLGVSEAEVVAAKTVPGSARPLRPHTVGGFVPLVEALRAVGDVIGPTRSENAVVECYGAWEPATTGTAPAAANTHITVPIRSPGCVQVHTGPGDRVLPLGSWVNVLDLGYNLHLRTDRATENWIVRRPSIDVMVTALEVYNDHGRCFAVFFGAREPGQAEPPAWRDVLDDVVLEGAA